MGQAVVRRIRQLPEGEWLAPDEREELLADLRTVTDHVLSCGTLLGVLADLPAREQDDLLARLEAYRAYRRRWTQLGVASRPAAIASAGEAR